MVKLIRVRRIDLGLFQSQVAEQMGGHELTIMNWEGNASRPAARYISAIIRVLGYNPMGTGNSFSERLIAARRAQGDILFDNLDCKLISD